MARNQPQTPANAAYSYGRIEHALAAVFGIDAAGQKGWLRGRLQHVRRLGLVADSPGRGRTIDYTPDDAAKWLFVLTLERMRFDPTLAVKLVEAQWGRPGRKERDPVEAAHRGEATLCELVAAARQASRPAEHVIITVDFSSISGVPVIGHTWASEGMKSLGSWLAFGDPQKPAARLVTIFDLSDLLHRLDAALTEGPKPQPPQQTGPAAMIIDAGKVRRGEMTLKEFRAKHRGKRSK